MIDVQLLGDFVLRHGTEDLSPWRRAGPRRLFKLLLAAPGHSLGVESLAVAFWPGDGGEPLRQRLHHLTYLLRSALDAIASRLPAGTPALRVELRDDTLRLTGTACLRIDVPAFESALQAALAASPDGGPRAREALAAALDRYRGVLLPGEQAGEAGDDWLRSRREHLAHRHLHGLHTLARWQREAGLPAEAIGTFNRVLAIEPADEGAHRGLIECFAVLGERDRADRQFADCKAALQQAIGVAPGEATRQAHQRALLGVEVAGHGPVSAAARFVPPAPLVDLIDREPLVAEVIARLRSPAARQLTLLGAGGMGKTQLALRIAHDLAPSLPHGACFVALDEVGPADVPDRLRRALRLTDVPAPQALAAIGDLLEDRRLLLVLDNCEHVVESLGFVAALLSRCPGLKVLATSRRPLNHRAEQVVQVPGLDATPDSGMKLFVQRARAQAPGFAPEAVAPAVLAAITRRLDGVPLSIELVAARVRAFAPEELLRQLDQGLEPVSGGGMDRPARHRSLEASFAWSRALLAPLALQALDEAVRFQAPFEADAWAAVCGLPAAAAADTLQSLVELGLVQRAAEPAAGRFQLHASARSVLSKDGAPRAPGRFVAWFTARAQALDALLEGTEAARAMAGFEADHENFFAALQTAGQAEAAAALAALVQPLVRYWCRSCSWGRADEWVERAVQASASLDPSARIALWLSVCTYWIESQRDARAAAQLQATMALAQSQGDAVSHAHAAISFGGLAYQRGESALAIEPLRTAQAQAEAAGRDDLVLTARNNLANCWLSAGEFGRARTVWLACARSSATKAPAMRVAPLFNLSLVAHYRGERAEAHRLVAQALAFEREGVPRPARLALILVRSAWMHACEGDAGPAASALQAARSVVQGADLPAWLQICAAQDGKLALVRGDAAAAVSALQRIRASARLQLPVWDLLDLKMWLVHAHLSQPGQTAAARAVLSDLVAALGAGWRHEAPRVLEWAAAYFVQDGRPAPAARAWAQAKALREVQGTRRFPFDQVMARRTAAWLRQQGCTAHESTGRAAAVGDDAGGPLAWLPAALA